MFLWQWHQAWVCGLGDDSVDEQFRLSSLRGRYVVLFFYPLDFTFVCPSEILAFDEALQQFRERETEVVGVSVDSHYTHIAWRNTPVEEGGEFDVAGHTQRLASIIESYIQRYPEQWCMLQPIWGAAGGSR